MTYKQSNPSSANFSATRARLAALLLCTVALPGCAAGISSHDTARADMTVAQPALENSIYQRGKWHFQQGQYGLALDAFTMSLQMNPGAVREMNAIAACYDRMQRFDLADQFYRQALATDPTSVITLNNFGYSHLMRGEQTSDPEQVNLAWTYFEKARKADGTNPVVAANLSKATAILAATRANSVDEVASTLDGPVKIAEPAADDPWMERASGKTVRVVTTPDIAVAALARDTQLPVQIVSISTANHRELLNAEPARREAMLAFVNVPTPVEEPDKAAKPTEMVATATVSIVADQSGDLIDGAPASVDPIAAGPLAPLASADISEKLLTVRLHAEIFGARACDPCVATPPFLREHAPVGLLADGQPFVQIAALPSSGFEGGMIEDEAAVTRAHDGHASNGPRSKKHPDGAVMARVPLIEQPISWFVELVFAD